METCIHFEFMEPQSDQSEGTSETYGQNTQSFTASSNPAWAQRRVQSPTTYALCDYSIRRTSSLLWGLEHAAIAGVVRLSDNSVQPP